MPPSRLLPNPVIFVPGVTATDLRDLYCFPPSKVWGLMTHDYDAVGLHPENQRYEGQLPSQITPDQIFEIAYKEMILDLRHDLTLKADKPVPVYIFGYDWRQPLEVTQASLAAFIQTVIEKTCLMKHYYANSYPARGRVNLVAHSMGGMVVTGYLAGAGAKAPVDRVADAVALLPAAELQGRDRDRADPAAVRHLRSQAVADKRGRDDRGIPTPARLGRGD
jgi:hypothetical protein